MNTRENAIDDRDARLEQSDVSDGKERLSETEVWQLSKNTSIATSCSKWPAFTRADLFWKLASK